MGSWSSQWCWFSGLGHHPGTGPEPSSQRLSTEYPLMYMTIRCASPEVHYYFFCFCGVEEKVVSAAPRCQFLYLVPVCRLIFPHDESNCCHVICEIPWGAVGCVESVQQESQHTSLWQTNVEAECWVKFGPFFNSLWAGSQEVLNPESDGV